DINIAMAMAQDATITDLDMAVIISADSDLCAGVEGARSFAGLRSKPVTFHAAFPPGRYSQDLEKVTESAAVIDPGHLRNALLPDVVVKDKTGRKYRRSGKWWP
ncbi:MAG: hypothetical protein ACRD0P_31370, partial [Stackebrandtia sp.]